GHPTPPPARSAPYGARSEEISANLGAAGIARGQVTLAWDVVTASDAAATGHLLAMRDTALDLVSRDMVAYTVDATPTPADTADIIKQVNITLKAPSFLDANHKLMNVDAAARPALNCTVAPPRCDPVPP